MEIVFLQPLKERWQSGRMRRSWKPLTFTGPGVRIPPSPHNESPAKWLGFRFCFISGIYAEDITFEYCLYFS